MLVAKLNDGRVVVMLARNKSVQFDRTRSDWCLCYTNSSRSGHLDCPPCKRDLFWLPATMVARVIEIADDSRGADPMAVDAVIEPAGEAPLDLARMARKPEYVAPSEVSADRVSSQ